MPTDLSLGIVGAGGDGVILLGEMLARACARSGLHTILLKSYGPQIRGGESSARLRVSDAPLYWAGDRLDALLLFNWRDLARFSGELALKPGAQIVVEAADDTPLEQTGLHPDSYGSVLRIPLDQIALDVGRSKQAKNMVMAGVACELWDWPEAGLSGFLRERFKRHSAAATEANLAALQAGRDYAREHFGARGSISVSGELQSGPAREPLHFISGDEAFALGSLAAGCRFMAGYPISPASEILEWMSRELPRYGGCCMQAEDEIAGICMALGASYGGVRALTATSGPGFSLKQEALGLATMAEIPVVVCDVQRCGPSTGIPTRTEQADLGAALSGGHGDSPRVVLAAVSVADCAAIAREAFDIAERYQTPVVVLLDQYLGQSVQTVSGLPQTADDPAALLATALDDGGGVAEPRKPRYDHASGSGVSAVSIPGTPGGEFTAVGIEHSADGNPTSSQEMHVLQTAKRYRKLETLAAERSLLAREGATEPLLGILTWGSVFGAAIEAAQQLTGAGLPAQVLAPRMLNPLPAAQLQEWLDRFAAPGRCLLTVETSYSQQFVRHLRGYLRLPQGALHLYRAGGTAVGALEILRFALERLPELPGFERARIAALLD